MKSINPTLTSSILTRTRLADDNFWTMDELWKQFVNLPLCATLLGVEIQEHLLSFLLHFCREVLHDHTTAQLMESGPVPEPSLTRQDSPGWLTIASIRQEAAYQIPGCPDVGAS